jgi:hypothetical protein
MSTGPELRRDGRRRIVRTSSGIPPVRGLRAAHVHDLAVRPGEAAAAAVEPQQDAVGGITESSEA